MNQFRGSAPLLSLLLGKGLLFEPLCIHCLIVFDVIKVNGHEHMVERGMIRVAGLQSVCIQAGDTHLWSFELDTESRLVILRHNLPYLPSLNP